MNDIEKLSPSTKKMLALLGQQESTSQIRERMHVSRAAIQGVPLSQVSDLDPLEPVNTLPDVGDNQDNLLPRSQLPVGITFKVVAWEEMEESGYNIYFALDDEDFPAVPTLTVEPDFDDFEHTIQVNHLQTNHGIHRVKWYTEGHDTGNPLQGPALEFFIDIYHPNMMQQPDRLLLPDDLPNGDITLEYLEQNGGVTFTLPPFSDPRVGDTFTFYIDSIPFISDQSASAPYEFTVPASEFVRVPEGRLELNYTLQDRAGNRSDKSLTTVVYLVKSAVPIMRAPIINEGPHITLDDARDGVIVQQDFDFFQAGDQLTVYWDTYGMDLIQYPTPSTNVPLNVVKLPGTSYEAEVYYVLNRNGKPYESPKATVTVDLQMIGPDPDVPEEIVNPKLEPLALVSFSGEDNKITPADMSQNATITVEVYTPVIVGEIIEVFYGATTNSLGAKPLAQTDIDAGEITVSVPWALINSVGNGTIDAFYRIYPAGKPENSQQSPITPILVTVHNLQELPLAVFPDRNVNLNIINCVNEPWLKGVNVRLDYPNFEEGDRINLNWVLDSTVVPPTHTTVPTQPLEPTRTNFPHTITAIEASAGRAVVNVWWDTHISALTEGCLVVEWTLQRGDIHGSSAKQFVRYSRHRPGAGRPVCPDDDPV